MIERKLYKGINAIVFFYKIEDIADVLEKETSYRVKHLPEGIETVFTPDDELWLMIELPAAINNISILFGDTLLEEIMDEGKYGLMIKYNGHDQHRYSWMDRAIFQLLIFNLALKWYQEKGVDVRDYAELALRKRTEIADIAYILMIDPHKVQIYPHEDKHFWGDDYDMKPELDKFINLYEPTENNH